MLSPCTIISAYLVHYMDLFHSLGVGACTTADLRHNAYFAGDSSFDVEIVTVECPPGLTAGIPLL